MSSRLAEKVLEVVDRTCWENTRKVVGDEEGVSSDQATSNIYSERNSTSVKEMEKDGDVMARRTSSNPRDALRRRIAALAGGGSGNTFVYPTGMAAVSAAHRLMKLNSDWDQVRIQYSTAWCTATVVHTVQSTVQRSFCTVHRAMERAALYDFTLSL